MFEKEAEERITGQFGTSGEYVTRQRIWRDGAEFGYNKANEWHKVADGDLPNNARTVIIAYYAVDAKTVGTKEIKRTNEIVTEQCFYLENQGWTDTSDGEPYPYLNMEGVVIAWCELPIYKE